MTAPMLATRDALTAAIESALARRAWEPGWRSGGNSQVVSLTDVRDHLADALARRGDLFRDPATLAETPDFLYRVTNRAIPLHPTGRVTVTETQAVLRALAAALTEDPS